MKLFELNTPQTMTLFHGSTQQFDHFDLNTVNPHGFGRGMGFHFVNDMSLAKRYAGPDGYVYVAEITVSNPLVHGEDGSGGPGLDRDKVKRLGYDSYMFVERRYKEVIVFDTDQINVTDVINMRV